MATATVVSLKDLQAQIAKLEEENARLKEARNGKLSLRVSAKGAVSCYGMGRFPVTLYRSQWERLLAAAPMINAFIEANKASLATKD